MPPPPAGPSSNSSTSYRRLEPISNTSSPLLSGSQKSTSSSQLSRGSSGRAPNPQNMSTLRHLGRLFRFLRPEMWWILGATLSTCAQVGISLVQPRLTGYYFTAITENLSRSAVQQSIDDAHHWVFWIAGISAGNIVATIMTNSLYGIVSVKLMARSRTNLMSTYLSRSTSFFDMKSVGELLSRLGVDVGQLQSLTTTFSQIIQIVANLVGSLVWMFNINYLMTFIILGTTPFLFLFSVYFGNLIRSKTKIMYDYAAERSTVAQEVLANIRTVRAYDQEDRELNRFMTIVVRIYRLGLVLLLYGQVYGFSNSLLLNAANIAVLYIGGDYVINRTLQLGDLYSFVSYANQLTTSTRGISGMYTQLMSTIGGTQVLVGLLLDKTDDHDRDIVPGRQLNQIVGRVTLDNLVFRYPARPLQVILNEVSVDVDPGETLAVIGPSGSGKSSIFALLMRFYEPEAGRILLDGVDIRDLDKRWLRQNMAIVTQEPVIFTGTVFQNISYGTLYATPEDVYEAARRAYAHDFILDMVDGYETKIGPKGSSLSGGQKQRIAIARAFVKNSPILLLDEATSALDGESEAAVQAALNELMRGKTVFMISHRMNTIRESNRILVLSGGRVQQLGSHQELMQEEEGFYARQMMQLLGPH